MKSVLLALAPALLLAACGLDPCDPAAQGLNVIAPGVGVVLATECQAQVLQGAKGGDLDGDGIPDPADGCPLTASGAAPDAGRPGCPLPTSAALTFGPQASADGFTNINGVSWRATAAWDARVNAPATATLAFRAQVRPELQHALSLRVATMADLNTSANITDCAPPARDFVFGRCVARDLKVQVLAGGLTLYEADLSTSSPDWQPALPASLVLPVGVSSFDVRFAAIGSVTIAPRLVEGSDLASAVR